MTEITNKVVIITGSGTGVGAATARLFASHGCNVVINYSRNEEGANAVATQCEGLGVEVLVCKADISDDSQCRAMVNRALEKWGQIDYLVNNAGTTKFCAHEDLEGLSAEDFINIYRVNVIGAYQMTRAVSESMKSLSDGGAIVNVASIAGIKGVGSCIAYAASKGAMLTMTLSLARALGPKIRVNAVCPGFIQGQWLKQGLGEEKYAAAKSANERNAPLQETATAESVADAILHFVIGSKLITGEKLIVDGGRYLN